MLLRFQIILYYFFPFLIQFKKAGKSQSSSYLSLDKIKSKKRVLLASNNFWKCFIVCVLLPQPSFSQKTRLDILSERLFLKLGATYLNVARQNQIDIDSGLAIASRQNHLNRLFVIGENFDDILLDKENTWVAGENINEAKQLAISGNFIKRQRLLSLIGYYYAFQPGENKNDIDNAFVYLNAAKREATISRDNKTLIQIFYCLMKCYLEKADLNTADIFFKQAIDLSLKANDKHEEAMARSYWGTFSPFQVNTIAERINQLRKADTLFQQLKDNENEVNTLMNIGYLSFAAGKVEDSKTAFSKVLEIEESIHFIQKQYTFDLLALIAQIEGQLGTSLKYALFSLKSAEVSKDAAAYPYICTRVANAYQLFNDKQQEALTWAQKALSAFEAAGGDPSMYKCVGMISKIFRNNREYAKAIQLVQDITKRFPSEDPVQQQEAFVILAENYASLNYFPVAEKYINEANKLQNRIYILSGNIQLSYFNYRLGLVYLSMKKFEKSRFYLNKVLALPQGVQKIYLTHIEMGLSIIDSAKGDFKNAFLHAQKSIAIRELLTNEDQTKQIQQLRIQYETEKKDDNIKILGQQASLQKAQIKQEQYTKNIIIAGAAILAIFLGLVYNRFRLKERSNKLLELQQKEINQKNMSLQNLVEQKEWLLKEVHHRVKNNLQIIISLLNTQSSYLESNAAVNAIRESQERMQAISLIHQKLYKSEESAFINIREYVHELVDYIRNTFTDSSGIVFNLNIPDSNLDVAQAVPLGLILNEAVSNIFKYAFRGSSSGMVAISITHSNDENNFLLTINDNGRGLPQSYDITKKASFGIRLMQGLSKQMGGSFKIENDNGVKIEVRFKESKVIELMRNDLFKTVGQPVKKLFSETVD